MKQDETSGVDFCVHLPRSSFATASLRDATSDLACHRVSLHPLVPLGLPSLVISALFPMEHCHGYILKKRQVNEPEPMENGTAEEF